MKIGCIGLGLIGGSFALSMKRNFSDFQVFGMDKNSEHLQKALTLNIIDQVLEESEWCEMDVVILSIPVDHAPRLLQQILDKIHPLALVMDMGSTKGQL